MIFTYEKITSVDLRPVNKKQHDQISATQVFLT
jgi:hypothetical protein